MLFSLALSLLSSPPHSPTFASPFHDFSGSPRPSPAPIPMMAQLRGMRTEPFSSARDRLSAATIGLGSILRDSKAMSGMSRANMLLGLAAQSSPSRSLPMSPALSMASSPAEHSGVLEAPDADDFDEEDIWAAEGRSWQDPGKGNLHQVEQNSSQGFVDSSHDDMAAAYGSPFISHGHPGHSFKVSARGHGGLVHGHALGNADTATARISAVESLRGSRGRSDKGFGLADALANGGPVALSPLARVPEGAPSQLFQPSSRVPSASRMIPLSDAAKVDTKRRVEHQSAPVNVPDWSKILKGELITNNGILANDENNNEEEERLPPHELLAREHERSQRTTFSVCEGQGRTLKGRDLSRVRNAVWSKMGFAD